MYSSINVCLGPIPLFNSFQLLQLSAVQLKTWIFKAGFFFSLQNILEQQAERLGREERQRSCSLPSLQGTSAPGVGDTEAGWGVKLSTLCGPLLVCGGWASLASLSFLLYPSLGGLCWYGGTSILLTIPSQEPLDPPSALTAIHIPSPFLWLGSGATWAAWWLSPLSWPPISLIWGTHEAPPWAMRHCAEWAHLAHSPDTPNQRAFRSCWHRHRGSSWLLSEILGRSLCSYALPLQEATSNNPLSILCLERASVPLQFPPVGTELARPLLAGSPSVSGWFQGAPSTWLRGEEALPWGGSSYLTWGQGDGMGIGGNEADSIANYTSWEVFGPNCWGVLLLFIVWSLFVTFVFSCTP